MRFAIFSSLCFVSLWGCGGGSTTTPAADSGTLDTMEASNSEVAISDSAAADAIEAATTTAMVTVNASSPQAISPMFYGQNYWSWEPDWGDPVGAVQTQAAQLQLNLLRAGGQNNDVQTPDLFDNTQVDKFVAFAKAVGAQPLLQVPAINAATSPLTPATAQTAAAMVTYANVTKGYGIKYFSIGNEPDLYSANGDIADAGNYGPANFCTTFGAFADQMKAADPTIRIMGPDLSWQYQAWLPTFLTNCGSKVDIVSVHRYPFSSAAAADTAAADYADAANFRTFITQIRSYMTAGGVGSLPLAITETNNSYDGTTANSVQSGSPGTLAAALWAADVMGVGLEGGLFAMNFWSLSEGATLGFYNGTTPRPIVSAFTLVSTHFRSTMLTTSGAPTNVSVYAGRDAAAQKTSVLVVNKTTEDVALTVNITGAGASIPASSFTVAALSIAVADIADSTGTPTLSTYP
jgi:hypothetical protein